jgi:hypothetical protein
MAKLELVTPEGLLLSDKEIIPQVETCVEEEEPFHVKVAREHAKVSNTPKKEPNKS